MSGFLKYCVLNNLKFDQWKNLDHVDPDLSTLISLIIVKSRLLILKKKSTLHSSFISFMYYFFPKKRDESTYFLQEIFEPNMKELVCLQVSLVKQVKMTYIVKAQSNNFQFPTHSSYWALVH